MSGKGHVALIVEDEPETAEYLRDFCASIGHSSRHCVTLADVRAAIAEGGFCYVLLDMQIPAEAGGRSMAMSGETALKELRALEPRRNAADAHLLPILVVTAYSREPAYVSKMHGKGADGFIAKPFSDREEENCALIKEALRLAGKEHHESCGAGEDAVSLMAAASWDAVLEASDLQKLVEQVRVGLQAHDRESHESSDYFRFCRDVVAVLNVHADRVSLLEG